MRHELAVARRVLVVRMDNIGDIVMLGPALRALRSALPHASLTLLCSKAGAQAATLLQPWVDDVMVERAVWQDASGALPLDPGREYALIDRLHAGRFDAALIFTSYSQSAFPPAYACYLAGIPFRAGHAEAFGGSILTHAVTPPRDETHQVDRNLWLLESLGLSTDERDLRVAIPEVARHAVEAQLPAILGARGGYAVLAPAASCSARTYEADRFVAVGRLLAQRGRRLVLVGSERDVETCGAIADPIPGAVSVAGCTTIAELAALIDGADLLVASHSGPMHIADAVRTPMVILFAGTDLESQWRPRSAPAALLRRTTSCAPCHAFECSRGLACLDIPAAEVVATAEHVLRARAAAS